MRMKDEDWRLKVDEGWRMKIESWRFRIRCWGLRVWDKKEWVSSNSAFPMDWISILSPILKTSLRQDVPQVPRVAHLFFYTGVYIPKAHEFIHGLLIYNLFCWSWELELCNILQHNSNWLPSQAFKHFYVKTRI